MNSRGHRLRDRYTEAGRCGGIESRRRLTDGGWRVTDSSWTVMMSYVISSFSFTSLNIQPQKVNHTRMRPLLFQ